MKETNCTQSSAAGNSRGSSGCSWDLAPRLSPSRMHPRELSALVEGRAAAVGGLPPAAQCFGPELTAFPLTAHWLKHGGSGRARPSYARRARGRGSLVVRSVTTHRWPRASLLRSCHALWSSPGLSAWCRVLSDQECTFPLRDPVSRVQ